jgi:hypothetical protein
MHEIVRVSVLDAYQLDLTFDDGTRGLANLRDLVGSGVFALWNDYAAFQSVRIGDGGDLVWSEQVDLCPDSLYLRVTGKRPEDIFPRLAGEPASA